METWIDALHLARDMAKLRPLFADGARDLQTFGHNLLWGVHNDRVNTVKQALVDFHQFIADAQVDLTNAAPTVAQIEADFAKLIADLGG